MFEVEAPVDVDIQVGPGACDFVDSFAAEAEPGWEPSYYNGCNGYESMSGSCLTECVNSQDCDDDHYCVYEVGECYPRIVGGECFRNEECTSNICMCDVCIDEEALIDFIGSAAFSGVSGSTPHRPGE
ncbi:MAG: hypothetical protein CME70_18805 [Halobacteriovorax sp.]|nr:hypothetical protein [Halobacteriovorax sp.]